MIARRAAGAIIGRAAGAGMIGAIAGDKSPRAVFFPFFGDNYNRPAPAVDSTKAPPPRKLETPLTSTVMVIGDSLADWLAYGFDEIYADQPDIGFVRKIAATSGLIRYDAKNDQLDWPQIAKDTLAAEKAECHHRHAGLE